jgi:predicted site-specific integrase-resolvase
MDQLLTPLAASLMLGKSEQTIRLWAIQGKLPHLVTTTGRRLFRQSDVEEFLRKQTEEQPKPTA